MFSRRSSTKELVNLVTSRIIPVVLWRNKKGLKAAVLGAKFDQGTRGLWSLQEQGLDVFLPFSLDCASCVWSPGLAAVFLWRISLEISFKAFPRGTVTHRGTWCGSALPRPSESPFGYVHSLLRLRRNGVPHI